MTFEHLFLKVKIAFKFINDLDETEPIDEAISLSLKRNDITLICLDQDGELIITFTDNYQHVKERPQIIAVVHYKRGTEIHDNRYECVTNTKVEELKKKAAILKQKLQSTVNQNDSSRKENEEWHKRFRIMKIRYNLDNYKIAAITGNAYNSVRTTTQPNKDFPRNLKLAVWISEQK